jgi:signal transduction histidine kinase
MSISFTFDDPGCRLNTKKEIVLYRIAQEAITNIIKHAKVTKAAVSLHKRDGKVILKIQDKGKGFPVTDSRTTRGMGLLGMRERVDSVGGTLRISSHPGKGTVVEAKVPC